MQQNQPYGEESRERDTSALSHVIERGICIHTMTVHGCSLSGHIFLVLIRHLQAIEENPR